MPMCIFTDRCKLCEPEKATAIQDKLLSCLRYLLSKREGGPGTTLYKIFTILTDIQDLAEDTIETTKQYFLELPIMPARKDLYDKMLLLREFFG